MTTKDVKIEHYYALKPIRFPVLAKLELYQEAPPRQSPSDLSLEIELRPGKNTDSSRLCLSFSGVVSLRLVPSSSFVQFPFLEIRSIRDRHWENLRYEVEDTEGNTLSFFCKDFEVTLKEAGISKGKPFAKE
jgi:hypothetical protein